MTSTFCSSYSGRTMIYFLEHKSQVYSTTEDFYLTTEGNDRMLTFFVYLRLIWHRIILHITTYFFIGPRKGARVLWKVMDISFLLRNVHKIANHSGHNRIKVNKAQVLLWLTLKQLLFSWACNVIGHPTGGQQVNR